MTSPTQKGEREEALELVCRLDGRALFFDQSPWDARNSNLRKSSDLYREAARTIERLLSSSKAEGEMREALTQARQELWEALHSHMSEAEFNKEVEYIDAALSPKEDGK